MSKPRKYKYDVFISYAHKDGNWVRNELLPALEENGIKVIVDFFDFEPGAPSITEMEQAVRESRKTILVLTPAYIESGWAGFEANLAGTLDPAGRERRILPILLEKCDIPLRISYLTYLDFTGASNLDLQWKRLFSALRKKTAGSPGSRRPRPEPGKAPPPSAPPSPDLAQLRKVLLDCDELATNERLRAFFSDPRLSVFRAALPEASSLSERVDLLSAYLINRKFSTGESLLAVFLRVLGEKIPPADMRRKDYEGLM